LITKLAFVIDASVALAWCFEDETNVFADKVLERLVDSAGVVPLIWPLEVGNALIGAERRGRLSQAESERFLELLRQLPIRIESSSLTRMFGEVITLAREQNLSTYDAIYLDLAMRSGLPLVTLDEALHQAAIRCGVKVFPAQDRGKG
jgi:predicted nucleic acid-binding protein